MIRKRLVYSILVLAVALFITWFFWPAPAEMPIVGRGYEGQTLFELISTEHSNIEFENIIEEDDDLNFYTFQYLYNGGGVAVGDINDDDLPDIYFTGNLVSDKLYLNLGGLKFEDISKSAGIADFKGWKTGVTMCDVNQDGKLDIYVCRSGWYAEEDIRRNLLFINNGDATFTESGAKYGVDDPGYSVQAAFLDQDLDGDLDLYIANHPPDFNQSLGQRLESMKNPTKYASDRFYRNVGDGQFKDASKVTGVHNYGHGLGIGVSDMNNDGYPDVYVANDFLSPDYYYVNNKNGTFSERLQESFPHVSYFAMGSDIADFNNDGLVDLFVAEMLADDNKRQKTNMAPMNPEMFWIFVKEGFHYQMMRNSLQVNRGVVSDNVPGGRFSEIGYQAGVAHTDWSWGTLFADFNLDGQKDLVITNGYLRDTQDKDYSHDFNEEKAKDEDGYLAFDLIESLVPTTKLHNYIFENGRDYKFIDRSTEWGIDFYGSSHGVAYADLDNDGDLDLVISNTNDVSHIYANKSKDRNLGDFLKVKLNGPQGNLFGLGTKLTLTTNKGIQFQEFHITRGFQSSVEPIVHFGLARDEDPQSLLVEWPGGKSQLIKKIPVGSKMEINWSEAAAPEKKEQPTTSAFFTALANSKINFKHTENEYDDYAREVLLPHKLSHLGPGIAVGDINGDGLDDCYIGGAANQSGALFKQLKNGEFEKLDQTWGEHTAQEDVDALFFDADGDKDLDLYVVSGGNECEQNAPWLQDRLYLNDGKGKFSYSANALPEMLTSGGCVAAGDFDSDGNLDLFVGGRLTPGVYPIPANSYLLRNNGGKFEDVTAQIAPELVRPGMVTDAIWTDFNGDKKLDLIITGEWMPITLFENQGGRLKNITPATSLASNVGWWFSIVEADIDKDGDPDYVVGNLGTNYKYQASTPEPFEIYANDFDESGTFDIVLSYYNDGTCFPVRGLQCSSQQVPSIKKKFPRYNEFGQATLQDVYGSKLETALHYSATNFSSSVVVNQGGGKFELRALPAEAQFSPIMGIIADDINQDGYTDLITAGNLFVSEVETGRADAGAGLVMLGSANGKFKVVPNTLAGFYAPGDVRGLAYIKSSVRPLVLVANNNEPVTVFSLRR